MSNNQAAFDDWQRQAEQILINNQKECTIPSESKSISFLIQQEEQSHSSSIEYHLKRIEKLKNMNKIQFETLFKNDSVQKDRKIEPVTMLFKNEKQIIQMSKLVGKKFKAEAQNNQEQLIPQNEILVFFQQFLMYLYPEIEWQNIEFVKQRIKIVKKNKKEEEAKAKKLRQKQQRLKRAKKSEYHTIKSEDKDNFMNNSKVVLKDQSQ